MASSPEENKWPRRKRLSHEVPAWVEKGGAHPAFFITICCEKRYLNQLASDETWEVMLEAVEERERRGDWVCPLFLVMPDHLHALIRFEGKKRMKQVVRGWKRWIASQCGTEWQDDFFDHRLRDEASCVEKRRYILQNPVRAELVQQPEDWPYVRDLSGA